MFSEFSKEELSVFKNLNTPSKIQDFLDKLKVNWELKGPTCYSPRKVLKKGMAHCVEGAVFAAAVLRFHGHKSLLVDMEASSDDFDHVIAVFKKNCCWGAIGKSNHAGFRYREPIYKNIRELVMSFFHEYFIEKTGKKSLRAYSKPVDLSRFDKLNWMVSDEDIWFIPEHLAEIKHYKIINKSQIRGLRKADDIEIKAGLIVGEKQPYEDVWKG